MRDVELGHIVKGRHATIATHLQHFLSYIGKDTKLKELERTDCENYFYHRQQIYNIRLTLNLRRCVMKSYDELKAEMEAIQQQIMRKIIMMQHVPIIKSI
jgi:hypothetical protein